VRRQDFSFDLPEELIAQTPLAERSASRLLVLDGATGAISDRAMSDLPSYVRAGDLLVFNDTRVVAARVVGSKPSGGRVEIFLERVGERERGTEPSRQALVQLRASKPIREGLEVATKGGTVRILGREDELWHVELPGDALEFFETWGEVPLPPYIHRPAAAIDRERYQSIFAREKGAVAAPTASLHFDAPLVAKLEALGVGRAFVTLHVGAGTFQPLRTDDLDAHKMHSERVSVSTATWDAILRTRAAGGRVIAVGTTVVRALESAALHMTSGAALRSAEPARLSVTPPGGHAAALGANAAPTGPNAMPLGSNSLPPGGHATPPTAGDATTTDRPTTAWSGETRLFIRPGFEFQLIDAMVTNFHLPESTLLMLVSAFAGRENVLGAYAHAVRERYRFFSYGDAMLVIPARAIRPTDLQTGRGTP
jgi:S-adenosylmethionine:tRNA ribosyltransferase-isomerase